MHEIWKAEVKRRPLLHSAIRCEPGAWELSRVVADLLAHLFGPRAQPGPQVLQLWLDLCLWFLQILDQVPVQLWLTVPAFPAGDSYRGG